jgi:hypothetical protein
LGKGRELDEDKRIGNGKGARNTKGSGAEVQVAVAIQQ